MRILIVTPYWAPARHFGGPVSVGLIMAEDFIAAGHEVTVATTDALDERARVPADAPAEPAGAEVIRFPNVWHRLATATRGWQPRAYRRWVREHAGDFDAMLNHDVYSVLSVAASRAAAAAGTGFVLQPLGSLKWTRERGKPLVKRAFLRLWGRRTLRLSSALIYSTPDERADYLAAGAPPERLAYVPLPIDVPGPSQVGRAERPTLLFVGRLDPIKGLDRLLEALALVRAEVPEVRLELVGEGGAYRAELEGMVRRLGLEPNVAFLGYVSAAEKVDALTRAHALCLLSRSEGRPLAAFEAMACGTPVVASRATHLTELPGRAGKLVSGDPEETAAALVSLLRDPEERERLGRGGREIASAAARERVAPRMLELLERVAAAPAAPLPDTWRR